MFKNVLSNKAVKRVTGAMLTSAMVLGMATGCGVSTTSTEAENILGKLFIPGR